MKKITKVVIPVAGKGTRFLPVSKVVPKTLFPIINKPIIHYLFEEIVQAGIKDIIIVKNPDQNEISDYFNLDSSYYQDLKEDNSELKALASLIKQVNIHFITQEKPRGLGDAILCAKPLIGEDDFAVVLGDNLVQKSLSEDYGIVDLVKQFELNPAYYLGVNKVKDEDTSKYGIIAYQKKMDQSFILTGIVEKPITNPPSNYAACGRYVLKNTIFTYLENQTLNSKGEIELTDAIEKAIQKEMVFARLIKGNLFDTGNHLGYLKAVVAFGIKNHDMRQELLDFVEEIKKEA